MQILLPPSETKRLGGVDKFDATKLSHVAELGEVRSRVRAALEAVSRDEATAARALKLGTRNRDERLLNLVLDESGVLPAAERYTGVLFDALNVNALGEDATKWVYEHVRIQSALFGLLRAADRIPPYRVSASSRLPQLTSTLARTWASPHANILAGEHYVLDLRSKDYVALAPLETLGAREFDRVEVVARGDDGVVRALNHFNKAAKGALVRRLAETSAQLNSRADLVSWADINGLELLPTGEPNTLRLVTEQGVPASSR